MATETSPDFKRFLKLIGTTLCEVADDKRDPGRIADLLQAFKQDPDRFDLRKKVVISDPEAEAVIFTTEDWLRFYQNDCGIAISESDLVIPPPPSFPHWLVVEPAAFTPNMGFAAMEKRFKPTPWKVIENLDEFERITPFEGVRAFYVKARIEADEELKNRSAEMNWNDQIPAMTLQAREALECLFCEKTGKHLDQKNVTRCDGSRRRDGFVPNVDWNPDDHTVRVYWWLAHGRDGCLRARQQFP